MIPQQVAQKDPLLYGDYRTALTPEQPRVYEDIQDYQAAKALFEEASLSINITPFHCGAWHKLNNKQLFERNYVYLNHLGFCYFQILEEYNENHKPMNLVLFDDALEHLTRVHRVIRMDQGHALLVGVGGSGRQSVARLAAFAANCEVFEITLTRGYGEEEFREDLKQLYNKLGIENKKVRPSSCHGYCTNISAMIYISCVNGDTISKPVIHMPMKMFCLKLTCSK